MKRVLKLFCNNNSLKDLKSFCEFYKIRFTKSFTIDSFFEFNRKIIFDQLSNTQLQKLAKKKKKKVSDLTTLDIDKNVTLPCPSYLQIQEEYVDYSLIAKNTNFQKSEVSVIAFEDKNIRAILDEATTKIAFGVKTMVPGCRVIGWFKSMYFADKKNTSNRVDNIYDNSQNFFDLSKFVVSMNTSVNENGGNFSISLPHIPVHLDVLNNMTPNSVLKNGINATGIDKEQISNYQYIDENDKLNNVSKSSVYDFDYFEWLIQPNDLLFISFDDMKDLTDDNLAGHTFDMIALIDSVSVSRNANGIISVDVTGRDLMKLITDDSSIFFPLGVSSGSNNIFQNTETVNKGGDLSSVYRYNGAESKNAMRQFNGMLNIFACEPNDFSIDFVLKTVVSHLANIQIVPDNLFISWGDKRTTFSTLKPKNK